ncbi:MAG: hypothetical protein CL913_00360 [Deltaproteobacteria bacterium]|nr:hypothetical protein [Deltaproteobacteria bacterium]
MGIRRKSAPPARGLFQRAEQRAVSMNQGCRIANLIQTVFQLLMCSLAELGAGKVFHCVKRSANTIQCLGSEDIVPFGIKFLLL